MGQTWAVEKTLLQPGGKLGFCWADLWWCFWCRVSLLAIWRIWSSSPNLQEFNGWLWPLSKWLHQMSITPQVIHVFSTLVWVKYKFMSSKKFSQIVSQSHQQGPTHDFYLFSMYRLHLDMNTEFKNGEVTNSPTNMETSKLGTPLKFLTWKQKITTFEIEHHLPNLPFFGFHALFSRVYAPQHWCHTVAAEAAVPVGFVVDRHPNKRARLLRWSTYIAVLAVLCGILVLATDEMTLVFVPVNALEFGRALGVGVRNVKLVVSTQAKHWNRFEMTRWHVFFAAW